MNEDQNLTEKNSDSLNDGSRDAENVSGQPVEEHTFEQSQKEDMDVHRHSKLHHKRHLKDYLLEFLMIFLAVTAGFFAENFREHLKEKEQIHIYMQSMVEDLKSDINMYRENMDSNSVVLQMTDSLITKMKRGNPDPAEIYYLALNITLRYGLFHPNNKTFDLLKNSGSFRLIKSREVLDTVTNYYYGLEWIEEYNSTVQRAANDIYAAYNNLLDGSVLFEMVQGASDWTANRPAGNPKLLAKDPGQLNLLATRYFTLYVMMQNMNREAMRSTEVARQLVAFLQKRYDLN